jgi:hypothetical protein
MAAMSSRDVTSAQPIINQQPLRLELDAVLGRAMPDRLTLSVFAYLALPGLLFLAGWTAPWAGMTAGLAGGAALALALRPAWRGSWPLPRRTTLLCLAMGMLWAGATGAHHLVYSTADWEIRDAVLRDLATGPWPVGYRQGEEDWLLRAPLGFYLPAGLVGRLAGFHAAQAALWVWSGIGLWLALALLAILARRVAPTRPVRGFAVMAAIFVLFHGLDLLPNMWLDWSAGAGILGSWGRGGEWWARLFQYSGHVTATLWAPNHAFPAWLVALLLLRHWQSPAFARVLALPLAGCAFWSPVAAAGAAVLSAAVILRRGHVLRAVLAPPNLLAVVFAVPLCLYLIAGSTAVRHEPLLLAYPPGGAIGTWALFLFVEVLCWAGLAALLVRGWLFGAAVVLLCLLPAYIFGPGNEMTSRGGLTPLAVLAVVSAAALLAPASGRLQHAARGGLLLCAALAAAGAGMEASLLVAKAPWPASKHCSLPEAASESVFQDSTDWSHYRVRWPDRILAGWMREPVRRPVREPGQHPPCWPGRGP